MIQEYLFTSDQYKADLENLSISPKVTKEIACRIRSVKKHYIKSANY